MTEPRIDADRLWGTIMETAAFGATPKGGVRRLALSEDDLDGFHGIALPDDVLAKIYHGNFQRLYSLSPKPLNTEAVKIELERMAASIDEIAGGEAEENPARQALELF